MQVDIERVISSQLKTNALKSLFFDENFYSGSQFCFTCSDYTISSFLDDKDSVLEFINNLNKTGLTDSFAEYMSELTTKTLQDINQFLIFGSAGKNAVKRVYKQFLGSVKNLCLKSDLSAEDITSVFLQHYINLRNALITSNGTRCSSSTSSPLLSAKRFAVNMLHSSSLKCCI